MKFNFRVITGGCLVVLLQAGCGGGGGAPESNMAPGQNSVLTMTRAAAPVTSCPNGGISVDAGIDANSNGVLDAAEVTSTQYVCNGTNATNVLVSVTTEPAGANCASGGKKVSVGSDSDGNDILDAAEIVSTDYICNGTNGVAGPSVTWVNVTGTTVQAEANTGYLANNASQVAITLPSAPAVGDVVQVSGIGSGGWKVAQNAGQFIIFKGSAGAVWTARGQDLAGWTAVASSADGSKLVAAADGGQLYTSADSGVSWSTRESVRIWRSVASSADGSKLVAAADGGLYTSADSGVTWSVRGGPGNWFAVASSADGNKLVAAAVGGQLYTSTDSGVTWTARESSRLWNAVASSADGNKLVAAVYGGMLYTSADSGVNWTARSSGGSWNSVASSADGSKLVAADWSGLLYTSTNSGLTWAARGSATYWSSVASSADGSNLVAAGGGQLYTSADSGVTWIARESTRNWYQVASSADGSKLVAADYGGKLYTSYHGTSVGDVGSISGTQYESVDLQCVDTNTFMVRGYVGDLVLQ